MADYVAARTAMVDNQVRPSDVTAYPVIEAMLNVPREKFVSPAQRPVAYQGEHIEVGAGRSILDPRVFAKMLEAASVKADDLVLDLGCATGYSAAVLGRMTAAVIAVEEDEELAKRAQELLAELEADNVAVECGPLNAGWKAHAPFNLIFLEGAVEVVPAQLPAQLKEGGRLVALEMEGTVGRCVVYTKTADGVTGHRAFDGFAPMLPGFARAEEFTF